jgi:hypothetical protein
MSGRQHSLIARARLAIASIALLATAAISAHAQSIAEQQVKTYVEGLRGRVSEAAFENGR